MSQLLYLASPYSHSSAAVRQARFEAAVAATCALIASGRLAISPIVHSHPLALAEGFALPGDWQGWQELDSALLARCDALVVAPIEGYLDSVGVAHEVALAVGLRLTVRVMMTTRDGRLAGLRPTTAAERKVWSNLCEDYAARQAAQGRAAEVEG